jgi:Ca-activated chloride channel family protein
MQRPVSFDALAAAILLFCFAGASPSQPVTRRGPSPIPFRSPDGKHSGWKITIPGGRPLATPAVVNGQVFVGGGFGSHEFYAFDAATGNLRWVYRTADDGPTAAVFGDGRIVFNTESCELEVITPDGKPVWKKWLGDPLMSMPAIADGVVYMAYPNSRRDSKYYVAAFELANGKQMWRSPIAGEIITAPVVDGQRLYLATVDGSLISFDRHDGTPVWTEHKNATSAPAVWNERCYFSRREVTTLSRNGTAVKQQNEVVALRGLALSAAVQDLAGSMRTADYLDYEKRFRMSRVEVTSQALDASVGFAGKAKGSASGIMTETKANLGQASVHGVWAYQGSKPFVDHGRIYNSMGDTVLCTDAESGKVLWKWALGEAKSHELADSALTPPAIVNGKVFVGSSFGQVYALSVQSGDLLWRVEVGEPVVFQPAVSAGRVYVSTNQGSVFSFATGDSHDDGWLMWGANSTHNGLRPR